MTADRPKMLAGMNTRQKITAIIFIIILIVLAWQIYGMFGGGSTSSAPTKPPATRAAMSNASPMGMAQPTSPQPATLTKPLPPAIMSQREAELLNQQQQAQTQYLAALNELQRLKIERDIADTTKAIMAAKLDTITAQKSIVDLLKPPPPPAVNYAQGLVNPTGAGAQTPPAVIPPPTQETEQQEIIYTVVSVSQLRSRWSAVVGFQGNLYNVYIGDILPPDQSKVISIDRSGIILDRNGTTRKVSLVPII